MRLEGIYPALITPFTKNGAVDENALCKLVDDFLALGVAGFYIGGSTGEALLMSKEERKRTLELICGRAKGKAELLAHIGCLQTADAIDLAVHAAALGVDAISSLPPFYYKFSLEEVTRYYFDIVKAAPLPLILYNAPALTGFAFDSQTLAPLFENPLVVGIKYTAYDLFQLQRIIASYPEKTVICGHDELYLSALAVGARCAIGSTFNFMAAKFMKMQALFENGQTDEAKKLQDEANRVIEVLGRVGVFRGVKGMLNLLGKPGGYCRKPFLPLTAPEEESLKKVLPLVEK